MPANTIPLFLDCDPGIDDAIAIAYLLCQRDVEIVGIAASGGNVSTAQVVRNTLGWLELAGRTELPVYRGVAQPLAQTADAVEAADVTDPADATNLTDPADPADPAYAEVTHGDTGSGYATLPEPSFSTRDTSAAQAWVDAARAHPGELIGVVIGPSTNLALALEIEPELPRLVKRLFVMGGAFNYRGNTHPTTEWNITFDPEAAARVFAAFGDAFTAGNAPFAPVIGPIEATEMVEMTPERLATILTASSPTPAWSAVLRELGEALRFYFEFHAADGHGYLAHIHDPYVTATAVEWARGELAGEQQARGELASESRAGSAAPATGSLPWATIAFAPVDVELTGTLTRGETVADWLGRWNKPVNAEIIRSVDAPAFLDHLTDTLMEGPHDGHTR
ncbi:nucleoside hydrolase [Leucobacter sp. NPDC058333]|uniref:nucleoside hydrolase n=1 Tax=Leucobacter sp. NPDC058333 TaxID=3346450 RepID=UPI0036569BB4